MCRREEVEDVYKEGRLTVEDMRASLWALEKQRNLGKKRLRTPTIHHQLYVRSVYAKSVLDLRPLMDNGTRNCGLMKSWILSRTWIHR
jgi:hypothetical protein